VITSNLSSASTALTADSQVSIVVLLTQWSVYLCFMFGRFDGRRRWLAQTSSVQVPNGHVNQTTGCHDSPQLGSHIAPIASQRLRGLAISQAPSQRGFRKVKMKATVRSPRPLSLFQGRLPAQD
jgi:hypothetical protein